MFIVANTVSNVIDKLREKHIVTTTIARKIAMNIGRYDHSRIDLVLWRL